MNDVLTIVNIDQTNAQQWLIDESFNRPIVVDFGLTGVSLANS